MLGPQEARWAVGYWLAALGHCLLSSHAQRRNNKKKLDVLKDGEQTCPKELIISREGSNDSTAPLPSSCFFSPF